MKVFLVENHVPTLNCMQTYLEALGHTVEVATDMTGALAQIPAHQVDLLLSDITLPDGNGWELLRRVTATRPLFAVAMSGFGRPADLAKSRAAGYHYHLVKPFMPDELDRILACAMAHTKASHTKTQRH